MIILGFSACFLIAFLLTRSYEYCRKYYATILYVSGVAVLYPLICRGYLPWQFQSWWIFNDKAFNLLQCVVLFPCTTVLYLKYFAGTKWRRVLCFAAFLALYILYEALLVSTHEITYHYGWNFLWSVFIDFTMFALMVIHARRRLIAIIISACIVVVLVLWFHVPIFNN